MTIALGFQSRGGIALCTDSQITKPGGLKYNARKIHYLLHDNHVLGFAYAGSPDVWALFLEKMEKKTETEPLPNVSWLEETRIHMETVLDQLCEKHREEVFEVFCAASHRTQGTQLYCGRGKLVTENNWECFGVGDSSVVRYLSHVLAHPVMSANQCLLLGYYIIAQAKQFIDGCGGPTQGFVIAGGNILFPMYDDVPFRGIERMLSELLFAISNEHSTEEEINKRFKRFEDAVREIRWQELEAN